MSSRGIAKVIMVQGTSSHAGKSVLATALCRIFAQDGLQAAPFKAQNMSLNSYATPDGGEVGRSQAVQAASAMTAPRVEMNPVLIKPEGRGRSQLVVMGRPRAVTTVEEYHELKPMIWETVTSSLATLRADYDVVVIEGAGSPAEVNLKERDIVNMKVALHAGAPVLLVGDIDRGGVFAHLVGTMVLLEPEERALVKGLVINKFRGDPSLLTPGLGFLEERTGAPVAGVIPHFSDIHIPEEDSLGLAADPGNDDDAVVDVAVIRLPHIANFDDFDPLRHEPGVRVRYVGRVEELGDPDLVIIPGSKTTMADLDWLRAQGLVERILAARGGGTPVIGICAGYQMLGERLHRPGQGRVVQRTRRMGWGCCKPPRPSSGKNPRTRWRVESSTAGVSWAGAGASGSRPTRFTWVYRAGRGSTVRSSWRRDRANAWTCPTARRMTRVSPLARICTGSSTTGQCVARCWSTSRDARE